MLPHFPALLLLLVSSGGSDFSPPPPPPWKAPSTSRPSPQQGPAGRQERGQAPDTLTSSPPEIKVRHQVLSDVAGRLLRPSSNYHEASPSSHLGGPRGGHGGQMGQGSFILQPGRMVTRSPQAPPSTQLSTHSISTPPRPWVSSSPSGPVNTWVISAASEQEESGRDNHHLAHQKPSLSTAGDCHHHRHAPNANQIISNTSRSARLPQPLTQLTHQEDSPLHHLNLRHNNLPSSASRDTSHPPSLTRPSGEPFLNEIRLREPSGSSSQEKLGHSTTAASTRSQVNHDDDSRPAQTDTFTSPPEVHLRDTHTEDDHTPLTHLSKASVKSSHATHLKHEMEKIGGRGGGREGVLVVGGGGGRTDFTQASPIIRHTEPPSSTVIKEHTRHTQTLLVSDNPGYKLMAKNVSLSNISSDRGNNRVYEADALFSKAWQRRRERPAQEIAPAALTATENGHKKTKNSLFKVSRPDREGGWGRGSSRVLLQQREKREAEGTRKNKFVVVDSEANEGQLAMAAGQGQDGGAMLWEMKKKTSLESTETVEDCFSEDGGKNKPKWAPISLPVSPLPRDYHGGPLGFEEGDGEENSAVLGGVGRVKRWASVLQSYNLPPGMYSRVLPGSFPRLYTSYHPAADTNLLPRAEALHGAAEGGARDTLLPQGSQGDGRYERKSSRASGVHAGRSSSRVKGSNKHVKGERGFTKTPQQRHARSRNRAKRKVPAREVWALAGDTSLLPCDLSTRIAKDTVQMVMWLREGTHTPLFSVDYREQASGKPKVWRDNTASTAQRAFLRLAEVDVGVAEGADYGHGVRPRLGYGQKATSYSAGYSEGGSSEESGGKEKEVGLMVRDMVRNDSAVYRCRVDFLLTPTRNTRVNLTVVVAPVRLSVEWWMGESGDKERDGVVGLFHEGQAPTLICETRNAWPPPRVVWFEQDAIVDDSFATDPVEDAVENTLTLPPLTRDHHNRRFTCIAINSNLTRPIATSVHLRMALDVLLVEMEDVPMLSAGTPAEVKCTVWGSNPEPHITWTLNEMILPSAKPWVSDDGNCSVSMVSFTPEPVHDGASLQCSAYNEMLMRASPHRHPPETHRTSILLVVNYAPRLSVSLGRTLEADNIKEGDDLYFECSAIAKPPPHKVTWSHNGNPLESTAGILVSNMTLVLQKVARANAGTYTCHATNSEGSAASPPLKLDVKYAPVCATTKPSQHSVAKHENARITCNVLANPPVVHFSWAFNNTAEAVNVPEDRYVVQGTESVVNYTPVTELDYGTLLCWATNDIGQQVHPCVFQIVAAGKPDPPHNCKAYDVTISSLQVSCLAGDDGGLGQKFVLQVVEANGDFKPVVEVTREAASFSVANLRPATAYRLLITATNAKGESRPAELNAYTVALNHPQHETPAEPTRGRESGAEVAVGVLVGAVLACLPVAIAVVVMGVRTCMRLRAARNGRAEESEESVEVEGGAGTGRPLLPGKGTPVSGGGVSAENGSDITTITGGVALSTKLPPTPSSVHSEAQVTQVAATDTSTLLYPGGRIYSPNRGQQVAAPPVLAQSATNLRRAPYTSHEDKFDGENELLEITLPPPAAYDQGYQSSYQGCQTLEDCYLPQEQVPSRMKPGYPQVFQEYQTVLPAAVYPQGVAVKGVHPNLQYISSVPLSQGYSPAAVPTSQAGPVPAFATLPHPKVTTSSSFSVLAPGKEAAQEGRIEDNKMSTVYNPLTLFPSPTYAQKTVAQNADRALHTGSLKRGVKPPPQDILRIRDSTRSRSNSLSSVSSNKRESSV